MNNIKNVFLGTVCAMVSMVLFLLILSAVLLSYQIDEKYVSILVAILFGVSVIIGAIVTTKQIKKNGVMYGAIFGCAYVAILYIILGLTTRDFSLSRQSIYCIAGAVMIGSIGGIIGVNIK